MRVGSISFINSLPVDWGILSKAVPIDAEVISSTPAALNQMLTDGNLEISPVSVFWYALHHKELIILPDLSISSHSSIHSVLLFSRRPIRDLKGRRIAVTEKGRTTPVLLDILCRLRYGFPPILERVAPPALDVPHGADALLLIGDDALTARSIMEAKGYLSIDLAEEWKAWTGLPIVFAVWAACRHGLGRRAAQAVRAHQALLDSKRWGLEHFDEILNISRERSGLGRREIENYFSVLRYDLGPDLLKGMKAYFGYALECGLLSSMPSMEILPTVATEASKLLAAQEAAVR